MELLHIDGEPFRVKGIEVVPIRLYHHKLPVYGFRFGKFAYLTDFNRIEGEELVKLKGVEVLIICALRKSIHISHLNLSEALRLADWPKENLPDPHEPRNGVSCGVGLKNCLMALNRPYDGLVIEI